MNIHSVNCVGCSSAVATSQAMNVAANRNPATIDTAIGRFTILYCVTFRLAPFALDP